MFIFITGFHDEGNLIATIITSRSLNVGMIFVLAFLSQFLGTVFLGTRVAHSTINGLLNLELVNLRPEKIPMAVFAAILGAVVWNVITWIFAIPSSSSHALVGGLLGPFLILFGGGVLNSRSLIFSILVPLFTSPIIGYAVGILFFRLCKWFFSRYFIQTRTLKITQILTCILINAFQGSNDAQKGIGVLALLALSTGGNSLQIRESMILLAALALSSGLVLGGLKMIRSVGTKIYGVQPIHSMCSQVSAASVIVSASLLGFPISGTQIVNSAIMGVGAADRPNAVGWEYAKSMLTAWAVTIPAAFVLSSFFYLILSRL